MTTECEHMLAELEEKVGKWKSAAEAAQGLAASEREKADSKIIEEEYLGLRRRVGKCVAETGTDDDRKRFAELDQPPASG